MARGLIRELCQYQIEHETPRIITETDFVGLAMNLVNEPQVRVAGFGELRFGRWSTLNGTHGGSTAMTVMLSRAARW
jgi:hypothetical protein